MNSNQLSVLLKNIQDMMKCPSCGARYSSEQIHFLGQLEMTCLVQLDCVECNLPVLAHFVVSDLSGGEARVLSDLSEADLSRLQALEPIDGEELLEAHKQLRVAGRIEDLFSQK